MDPIWPRIFSGKLRDVGGEQEKGISESPNSGIESKHISYLVATIATSKVIFLK